MTVRRMKAYTGEQGYVYQYYFVGKRPAMRQGAEAPATEYVFDVTADRKTMFSVSVFLERSATAAWASRHGRNLTEAEEYAAAKMRLLRGFDEIENMMAEGRSLAVEVPVLEELLGPLGIA